MLIDLVLTLFLVAKSCYAGIYGFPGDKYAGGPQTACSKEPLDPQTIGVAHRWLPCGTKVLLLNPRTRRSVVARVIDHGPYGAIHKGRWVLKRRVEDPGIWRGCIDMTPATAKAIRHSGMEQIFLKVVK